MQRLFKLTEEGVFPSPEPYWTEDNTYGEFAVGGSLSPKWLVAAYSMGAFPFYAYKLERLKWVCPKDRFVIFPEKIHVSHSMKQVIRKGEFDYSIDEAFEHVIDFCGRLREDELFAWLGPDMKEAYIRLHEMGYAHSVEVWKDDYLVGGLYGIKLGNCFFGESMFSLEPNASKFALIALSSALMGQGGFIDCQYETDHLLSMGGEHITYQEYMSILKAQDFAPVE